MSGSRIVLALAVLGGAGCVNETTELAISTPDRAQFDAEVYPVLLRDCAFHACHGSTERFMQVFGPGRGRIGPELKPVDPASPAEVMHSYDRARSMIDAHHPEASLILRKPLAVTAGGSGHEGADELGRNVYQTNLEPGYAAIQRWVLGTTGTPPVAAAAGGTPPTTTLQR